MIRSYTNCRTALARFGNRCFYKWLNTVFNKVDHKRILDVGADRAAAEWLLRCGASVKCQHKEWVFDYNKLQDKDLNHAQWIIEEIDATESCVMHIGFHYLSGLKYLKRIKFCKCIYLEDTCMNMLSVTKNSLKHLEVISCGNVSDKGILSISALENLETLYLYDLPEVKDRIHCKSVLQKNLPKCKIDFPLVELEETNE